ncbi:hypothetical protein NN561_017119 [Cricetulus griseus]
MREPRKSSPVPLSPAALSRAASGSPGTGRARQQQALPLRVGLPRLRDSRVALGACADPAIFPGSGAAKIPATSAALLHAPAFATAPRCGLPKLPQFIPAGSEAAQPACVGFVPWGNQTNEVSQSAPSPPLENNY